MLIGENVCPVCQQAAQKDHTRCPVCSCIVQFIPNPPTFSRASVREQLVQPVIDRCAQLNQQAQNGMASYTLGLCYLNYDLFEQGVELLARAATLMPEKHVILYELSVILNRPHHIAKALEYATQAQRYAPTQPNYQYMYHFLTGANAYARGEIQAGITSWIAAYQEAPQFTPAADALRQFVATHQAKLTEPVASNLPGLGQQEQENLRILNNNPDLKRQLLPFKPKTPGQLGATSMSILRRIAPERATALEQMHVDKVAAYQQATETYQQNYQAAVAQQESSRVEWQARNQSIRDDLVAMSRLSFAIVQEEERRRLEEERRRAEAEQRRQEAEQRRQEAEQRRLVKEQQRADAQAQATARAAQKTVREKEFFSTNGRYVSGLPKGKDKDAVSLVITNVKITIKHSGMVGAWDYTIPMSALINVSAVTVKHFMSSEKQLQISYHDERRVVTHAIFTDLNVDNCVKAVLDARSSIH